MPGPQAPIPTGSHEEGNVTHITGEERWAQGN